MAYTKNTWKDGDVITEEKLNNIENGVETLNEQMAEINSRVETYSNEEANAEMNKIRNTLNIKYFE